MEGLARAAGVSKQTVYRWWPTKAAVVLEALNEGARAVAPPPDTGSLEHDLRRFVRATVAAADQSTRILAPLMAEAQLDEQFAEAFRAGFLARRREVLHEILDRGRAHAEIAPDADLDLLVDLVFGLLWYRILARHAPLTPRFADQLTGAVLTLAAARRAGP